MMSLSRLLSTRGIAALLSGVSWSVLSGIGSPLLGQTAASTPSSSGSPPVTSASMTSVTSPSTTGLTAGATNASTGRFAVTISPVPMASRGTSTRPVTASEAASQAVFERVARITGLSWRDGRYVGDSVRRAATDAIQRWMKEARPAPATGMHLDAAASVDVAMDNLAAAQARIAERLATPGISLSDKAYTLRRAVSSFCDNWAPQRLPIAEQYLQQLIALGPETTPWQFEARTALMNVYYFLGRNADLARHGTAAIALLAQMPFDERGMEYRFPRVYPMTLDALLGLPNATAQIAALNESYRAGATVTPAELARLIAQDSTYALLSRGFAYKANEAIQVNAKLGKPGAPIVAHYWVNRGSPDSATVPVNDGKIRLLQIGNTDCPGCVMGFYGMQRLQEQFPQVEPTALVFTWGGWGGKIVDRAVEAAHLRDYFLTRVKATYPVAIWAGKRIPNEDDGADVETNPNWKTYEILGKPTFWLVDGKGMIRKIFVGFSRDMELQIAQSIEFLLAESRSATSSAASSSVPVLTGAVNATVSTPAL
jgi:hypothetical protein